MDVSAKKVAASPPPFGPHLQVTDTSQLLNRHRSIRSFYPDPIDPAIVNQVCIDAITGSSSSVNLNSESIKLTRDPERRCAQYELQFEQATVLQAPPVVPFCEEHDWLCVDIAALQRCT